MARGAWRGARTLGAVCARCGRGTLFTILYLNLKLKLIANTAQSLFTLCTTREGFTVGDVSSHTYESLNNIIKDYTPIITRFNKI